MTEQFYIDLKSQLPALIDAIKTGSTYATDLGHRIIQYDIATKVFGNISIFIVLSLIIFSFVYVFKNRHNYDDDFVFATATGSIVAFVFFIIIFITNILDIIKDIYIPEIRIVEIIKFLIK